MKCNAGEMRVAHVYQSRERERDHRNEEATPMNFDCIYSHFYIEKSDNSFSCHKSYQILPNKFRNKTVQNGEVPDPLMGVHTADDDPGTFSLMFILVMPIEHGLWLVLDSKSRAVG